MPDKDLPTKRSRQLAAWHRNRRAWLDANGPCVNCGSSEDLQVDHKDPSTKVSHKVWSWSPVRRAEELAKCQVLCKECHKAKSAREHSEWQAAQDCWLVNPKLTPADVAAIRASQEPTKVLAARYGIHRSHVNRVRRGLKWKHLP